MKKTLLIFSLLFLSVANAAKTPFIEGYWESWNPLSSPEEIASLPAQVFDIAFGHPAYHPKNQYKIVTLFATDEKIKRFVSKAHSLKKDVKIAILDNFFPYPVDSDQPYRLDDIEQKAKAIVRYVNKFDLDGVDFYLPDHPGNTSVQITFIKTLKKYLCSCAKISYTAKAISAIPSPCDEIIKNIHPILHSITIPIYNFGEGYQFRPVVDRVKAMGVPAEKIVISLMPGTDETGKITSLEDIKSIAQFVKQEKLGGISLWNLNTDHENLSMLGHDAALNSIVEVFNNK